MLQEGIQSLLGEDDPEKGKKKTVDNKMRQDWNAMSDWLTKNGYRDSVDLDKEGYRLFDKYVAENKGTSLNREMLPIIRQDMLNYRNWVLEEDKKKRAQVGVGVLSEGVTPDNFMRHVVDNEMTENPDFPGRHLTATKFPESYLKLFVDKKLAKVEKRGFSEINK